MKKFLYTILFLFLFISSVLAYSEFGGNYSYNQYNSNGQYSIQSSNPSDEVLFIVDFSGSMNTKMGYTPKAYLAIDALTSILRDTQGSTKVGLRIFGVTNKPLLRQTYNGYEYNKDNICTASELLLPIARYNAENISDKLSRINPHGGTPIGYSLRQAIQNDFSYGNHFKHIILITDGEENCGDNPCSYIRTIMNTRNDIRIDVIGITVDNNAYAQLGCIANAGRGNYYSINKPEDFKIKLEQAFNTVSHNNPIHSVPNVSSTQHTVTTKTIVVPKNNGIKYKTYGFQFEY